MSYFISVETFALLFLGIYGYATYKLRKFPDAWSGRSSNFIAVPLSLSLKACMNMLYLIQNIFHLRAMTSL